MVTLLRKLFIKDYQNVNDESVRLKHGKLAAGFGIFINSLLIAIKAFLAIFLASKNAWVFSMAIVGDAINNVGDLSNCIITIVGFSMAGKPADSKHPFGHERIEWIAGLIVAIFIVAAGVNLLRSSIESVIRHDETSYDVLTMILLGVAILLKAIQSYFCFGLAKAVNSVSIKATGFDAMTDTMATSAVAIAGILSLTLGYGFLDGYMGIAVSLFVIYSGIKMIKDTSSPLIGEALSHEMVEQIKNKVLSHPEIYGVHDIIIHQYGPTKRFLTLHVELNASLSFRKSHELIDEIEKELSSFFRCEVTIHPDPIDEDSLALERRIDALLKEIDPSYSCHDLHLKGNEVQLEVLLPYGKEESGKIEEFLKEKLSSHYQFIIRYDHPYDE